jgi:hypothetical protein
MENRKVTIAIAGGIIILCGLLTWGVMWGVRTCSYFAPKQQPCRITVPQPPRHPDGIEYRAPSLARQSVRFRYKLWEYDFNDGAQIRFYAVCDSVQACGVENEVTFNEGLR